MASVSIYQTLHGSCACGRNRYTIDIPDKQTQLVQLQYDNTSATRYQTASPLTLWLRVPLNWYTSATFAQFPDEERTSIKRTFVSPFASDTRRQFCGFCGTQLTSWHERTHDDSEHICLTVGSLLDEDQAILGQLGFLPTGDSSDDDDDDDDTHATSGPSRNLRTIARTEPLTRGAPWFEDMVEHTHLGKLRQQRGGHTSRNGNVQVEWEIVEWTEGDGADDEGLTPSKRKLGDVEAEDTEMRIT